MNVGIADGLRERKKRATRETIRENALKLVTKRGLDKVTVEDISQAANVSPRTFFNYFNCKEDAIIADNSVFVDELKRALIDRPAKETPLQAIRMVLEQFVIAPAKSRLRDDARRHDKLTKEHPELLARKLKGLANIEAALTAGVAVRLNDTEDKDAYPALLAAVSMAALRQTFHGWARGSQPLITVFNKNFDRLKKGF